MKRAALTHTKTKKLRRKMGGSLGLAVGCLELLWQLTARETPAGDIGRLSDEDIALGMEWEEHKPAELVALLVECGFLDEHPEHRLVVHDWSEHADDAVHMALYRKAQYFADGVKPHCTRLSGKDRDKADARYAHESAQQAHGERTAHAQCAHSVRTAMPEPRQSPAPPEPEPEPVRTAAAAAAQVSGDVERVTARQRDVLWGEFLETYPARNGDRETVKGREKFLALLKSGVPPGDLIEGVKRYRRWTDATGNTGTQFVKQITTWLNRSSWNEGWEVRSDERPRASSTNGKAHDTPSDRLARLIRERPAGV